jgi:hypothetical protein
MLLLRVIVVGIICLRVMILVSIDSASAPKQSNGELDLPPMDSYDMEAGSGKHKIG